MSYKIVPIDQFTDKKEVHELCRMLGTGQINQRAAQVAAWHLNNEMSWEELAAKRLEHANGTSQPYFNPLELRAGIQLAAMASNQVQQKQKLAEEADSPVVRPGKDTSLSSN